MKDYRFATESVVSITSICEDEELRESLHRSEYIRNETMKRCEQIPSYKHKSRKWKNKYYDLMKSKVIAEMK